jgi:hypothetical protein
MICWRYRSVFSLPVFWAAVFACLYVGLLQIRAESGGASYIYTAEGFGTFFLGLLAADFLFFLRSRALRTKKRGQHVNRGPSVGNSKPPEQPKPARIRLFFPPLPLNVGLFVSLLGAIFISVIFFANRGVPILSSFPAMAWVEATSGIINRFMTVFGPGCFASLGLVAWAVNRESGSSAARGLMYLGLGLAVLTQSLLATKAAALILFIWFNIMLFYLNKKRAFRKSLLPLIIIVVPISAGIVAVRSVSSYGYWQAGGIIQTFSGRLTTEAAEPLDFIFKYSNRFGPMQGGAMRLEVTRIKDQLTGRQKTPLLSEFIFDLLTGLPKNTTGLSAALTLGGTGYVEWGLTGLLLYSFVQGLVFGGVHRYLLRQEMMSLITLIFWGQILNSLMSASVGGVILVSFESALVNAIPPLVLLLPFCFVFLLPLAKRYGFSRSTRIERVPGGGRRWQRS